MNSLASSFCEDRGYRMRIVCDNPGWKLAEAGEVLPRARVSYTPLPTGNTLWGLKAAWVGVWCCNYN